jgi:serine/threonine protein kinase
MKNDNKKTEKYWISEVNCLVDVKNICNQVDILCFEEAFIVHHNGRTEFVIVTPFLEGYISLSEFIKNKKYDLSPDGALSIYGKIAKVKNAMTKLCLNHSDLHKENIMIDPNTNDVKVIDLGLCKTPEEEQKKYGVNDNDYSDQVRLEQIKNSLVKKATSSLQYEMNMIPVDIPSFTCVRKRSVWKIRNGEEFDAQVNHLIDRIEHKTRKDEIEELFKNLFEFIGMNESRMSESTKLQILKEINKQKKRIPDVNKYKKVLGEYEEEKEVELEEPEEGELISNKVSNIQEWTSQLSRLINIQSKAIIAEDSKNTMKDVLDFMLSNDPKYINDSLLDAFIFKINELSKEYRDFQKYLDAFEKLKKSREQKLSPKGFRNQVGKYLESLDILEDTDDILRISKILFEYILDNNPRYIIESEGLLDKVITKAKEAAKMETFFQTYLDQLKALKRISK